MQHACVVRELMFLLSDCANYRQRGDGKVTMLKQEITAGPRFTSSDEHIGELLGHMHEIADLSALDALSGWDQNTAMPEGGSEMRGAQQATLQGVLHERWTAPRLGSLLDELGEKVQQAPYTDADRGLHVWSRCSARSLITWVTQKHAMMPCWTSTSRDRR